MAPGARGAYDDGGFTEEDFLRSPGPKCLYRCGHYLVVEIVLDQGQTVRNADGSTTFGLIVTLRGTTQDTTPPLHRLNEYVRVATRNGRQTIVEVSNS